MSQSIYFREILDGGGDYQIMKKINYAMGALILLFIAIVSFRSGSDVETADPPSTYDLEDGAAILPKLPEGGQRRYGEAGIVPGAYPIMGPPAVTVEQMVAFFHASGATFPGEILGQGGAETIEEFSTIFYEEALAEGVRVEVAFAQTMKETGWLRFGGDSVIEQFNFAGIGTTGGGVKGIFFPDVRTGVRAQIQHLKAYASDEPLNQEPVVENIRFGYVTRLSAPYVEWLGQNENPAGKGWATHEGYGYRIVDLIWSMKE